MTKTSSPANSPAITKAKPPGWTDSLSGHTCIGTHDLVATGAQASASPSLSRYPSLPATGGTSSLRAEETPMPTLTAPAGTSLAESGVPVTIAASEPGPRASLAPRMSDQVVALHAAVVDGLEAERKAASSRLLMATRDKADRDGVTRGAGLPPQLPAVRSAQVTVDALRCLEDQAVKDLNRAMKEHPLGPWAASIPGLGSYKLLARLLGVIGSPYVRPEIMRDDGSIELTRPRTVSDLWSICGHGDATRRRRRGMTDADRQACGRTDAKTRVYLIAKQLVFYDGVPDKNGKARARSPYRDVYDAARAKYDSDPRYADWTDARKHASALRLTGKAFLKDLWREDKRLRMEETR